MALPGVGAMSMSAMNTELQRSSTAQLSMSDSLLRALRSKAAGAQYSFSELYNAEYEFTASMVAGRITQGGGSIERIGFSGSSPTHGSSSRSAYGGGVSFVWLFDEISDDYFIKFRLSGFSADPGKAFAKEVRIAGQTLIPNTAWLYQYASGIATWTWLGVLLGLNSGFTYSLAIRKFGS